MKATWNRLAALIVALGLSGLARADFSATFQQTGIGGTTSFNDPGAAPNQLTPGNFQIGGTGAQVTFTPGTPVFYSSYAPTANDATIGLNVNMTIQNTSISAITVRVTLVENNFTLQAGTYSINSNLNISGTNTSASGWTSSLWTSLTPPPAFPTSPVDSASTPLAIVLPSTPPAGPAGSATDSGSVNIASSPFTLYSVYTFTINVGAQVTVAAGGGSTFVLTAPVVPAPTGLILVATAVPMLGVLRRFRKR